MKRLTLSLLLLFLVACATVSDIEIEKGDYQSPVSETDNENTDDCNEGNALNPCSPLYLSPANPMIQVSLF